MTAINGGGGHGWITDVPDNFAEQILARAEPEYDGIFGRLGAAIGQMQKNVDLDAMILLQKFMVIAVNNIHDFMLSDVVKK